MTVLGILRCNGYRYVREAGVIVFPLEEIARFLLSIFKVIFKVYLINYIIVKSYCNMYISKKQLTPSH